MAKKILPRNGKHYKHVDEFPGIYRETNEHGTVDKDFYIIRVYSSVYKINTYITCNEKRKPFTDLKSAVKFQATYWESLKGLSKDKKTVQMLWENEIGQSLSLKSHSTIKRYQSLFTHHILPNFGHMTLTGTGKNALNVSKVNLYLHTVYNYQPKNMGAKQIESGNVNFDNGFVGKDVKVPDSGYSYEYVIGLLKCFVLIYNIAFESDYIDGETLVKFKESVRLRDELGSRKKEKDKKKIRILTQEQIDKINELLFGTNFYLPFLLSLYCGCRPGEAFGATFDDIDFKAGILHINKQFSETTPDEDGITEEAQAKYIIKAPKLGMNRDVPINDRLLVILKKRKDTLKQAKKTRLVSPQIVSIYDGRTRRMRTSDEFNFISRKANGQVLTAASFQYYAKIIRCGDPESGIEPICPAIDGIEDFSFYTFRKTCLSMLAARNIPVGKLMTFAGHKKIERIYESYYADSELANQLAAAAQSAMITDTDILFKFNDENFSKEYDSICKLRNPEEDDEGFALSPVDIPKTKPMYFEDDNVVEIDF